MMESIQEVGKVPTFWVGITKRGRKQDLCKFTYSAT